MDNLLSDALNKVLMSGDFWGDHSNVVPIVPGQARVMMMRGRRMQKVLEVEELEEVEEEVEKEV